MKTYEIQLESTTPIVFSKQLDPVKHPKEDREGHGEYDERIWREKAHWNGHNGDGKAIIPSVYFKRALEGCAKYLGIQIPGKGKSTYTKHFLSGVQIIGEGIDLGIKRADIDSVAISCNSDGKRGGGSRVTRRFPTVPKWKGTIKVLVVDEIITAKVLQEHLEKAGMLIGIGSFRLEKGNSSGGFKVTKMTESSL